MSEQIASTTHAIRQEAKRFQGLHHNLDDLYRLLQQIDNIPVKVQMRELVNNIEDCFQNSPEFTVFKPPSNYELKLGIVGNSSCGKSTLIHHYLTGQSPRDESLNGCHKKEVIVDEQSYLLLIRNETGCSDYQFVQWLDALMLVFNINDELSSSMLPGYFAKMTQYRDFTDIPLFLVGIKDIREKESTDSLQFDQIMKRLVCEINDVSCTEISVENIEGVKTLFQKENFVESSVNNYWSSWNIVSAAASQLPPHANDVVSLTTGINKQQRFIQKQNASKFATGLLVTFRAVQSMIRRSFQLSGSYDIIKCWEELQQKPAASVNRTTQTTENHHHASEKILNRDTAVLTSYDNLISPQRVESQTRSTSTSSSVTNSSTSSRTTGTVSPTSTPSSKSRSGRRRTIIFGSKTDKAKDEVDADQEIGIGRFIPVKQGSLLKRTANSLNKEWKKKFVILDNGGILTYYPSVNDYIENVHGKHIFLKQSTVKTPGKTPPIATNQGHCPSPNGTLQSSSVEDELNQNDKTLANNSLVISNDFLSQENDDTHTSSMYTDDTLIPPSTPTLVKSKSDVSARNGESLPRKRGRNRRGNKHTKSCELDFNDFPPELQRTLINCGEQTNDINNCTNNNQRVNTNETLRNSSKKKSHRRSKSHGNGNGKFNVNSDNKTDVRNGQTEEFEFRIVSLDGNSWNFAAQNLQDRDDWVFAIEQQILTCLQSNFSGRDKINSNSSSESDLLPIRHVPGNNICADCGEQNPDWATLNLGALICITCCGIHRNLGTHLSRVRSLDLDDWPLEYRSVMLSVGNNLANSIWEACIGNAVKPKPTSSREEKERWIYAKYKNRRFVQVLSSSKLPIGQQLLEAVKKEDLGQVILLLAHSKKKDVNVREENDLGRTPLHISCGKGNVVLTLLLIWCFADVTASDKHGRTALWYASEIGSRECEEVLRMNGCTERSCSESSNSACTSVNSGRLQYSLQGNRRRSKAQQY